VISSSSGSAGEEIPPRELSAGAALSAALGTTQRLLSGPGAGKRWKELAVIAAMAGVVGVGVQPPPLGLLQPVWGDLHLRQQLRSAMAPFAPALLFLALLLLLMGPVARAFAFLLMEGVASGSPRGKEYRRFLGAGGRHFVWSSLFTLPLYVLLFGAEAQVTRKGWEEMLSVPQDRIAPVFALTLGKFVMVLIPWMVLTLPAMAALYELTPAAMAAGGLGPMRGFRRVWDQALRAPARFGTYAALRLGLQLAGSTVALIALAPCLALSALLSAPILGVGWAVCRAAGGWTTPLGAGAAAIAALLGLVVLYLTVCAALAPVSVLLYAFAWHFVQGSGFSPPSRE
jgi:hypothetical protein